jgi:hypothetical protein
MSNLRPGDEELHHSDQSHRWVRPTDPGKNPDPDADEAWRQRVIAHVAEHRDDERSRAPWWPPSPEVEQE